MTAAFTPAQNLATVRPRQFARPRFSRRLTTSLALGLILALASVSTTFAATPGTWTGWTVNTATGCQTAAQVPFINTNGQVVANVAVYCPRQTWLTIRGRIRSDRTLTDTTVATAACAANGTCPVWQPAGTRYYTAVCSRSSSRVTHGYHSDIIIYPGTQSFKTTGSTSGSATLSPYCWA